MTDNNIPTKECNNGKHFFKDSVFCDRCDIDFDTWHTKVIEEAHKETCEFLLSALDAVIREQILARNLNISTGAYILDAIKDQCSKKGSID